MTKENKVEKIKEEVWKELNSKKEFGKFSEFWKKQPDKETTAFVVVDRAIDSAIQKTTEFHESAIKTLLASRAVDIEKAMAMQKAIDEKEFEKNIKELIKSFGSKESQEEVQNIILPYLLKLDKETRSGEGKKIAEEIFGEIDRLKVIKDRGWIGTQEKYEKLKKKFGVEKVK